MSDRHKFEEWLESQDEELRSLYADYSASKRDPRLDELENELGATRAELENLRGASELVASAQSRLQFYEEAFRYGVTNLKLAYVLAKEESLIGEDGADWAQLKARYPEVFSGRGVSSRIGSGRREPRPSGEVDMNAWIRQAAGR